MLEIRRLGRPLIRRTFLPANLSTALRRLAGWSLKIMKWFLLFVITRPCWGLLRVRPVMDRISKVQFSAYQQRWANWSKDSERRPLPIRRVSQYAGSSVWPMESWSLMLMSCSQDDATQWAYSDCEQLIMFYRLCRWMMWCIEPQLFGEQTRSALVDLACI